MATDKMYFRYTVHVEKQEFYIKYNFFECVIWSTTGNVSDSVT